VPTPSDLDSRQAYERLDPSDLHGRISALPEQFREAWDAAAAMALPEGFAGVERVAVLGMGGSGIGGALLRALAIELGAAVPIEIVRGYRLPAFVTKDTLAVASSNSGDTEEVVALAEQAANAGARTIVITTGGALLKLANERSIPALKYDWNAEPRAALGWSFATLLALTGRLALVPDVTDSLDAALQNMRAVAAACSRDVPEAQNPAKQLAHRWHGKVPVIVGADAMAPVAYRWRTQVNENAKSWGIALELPELNHNAPVGYGGPAELVPLLHAVLLRDEGVHPRVARRIELTREQMSSAGINTEIIDVPGASPLEQMLGAIQLGDFASYYLGVLNGANPSEVRALEWLKKKLRESD
jgi:glucose/mannose-6-phosphate isomerase